MAWTPSINNTGDRVRGIMWLLRLAAVTKRVLLVHHTVPPKLLLHEVSTSPGALAHICSNMESFCKRVHCPGLGELTVKGGHSLLFVLAYAS